MPTPTDQKVTFISRGPNQTLTRRSAIRTVDEFGHKVVVGYEEFVQQQEQAREKLRFNGTPEDQLPEIDRTPWKVEFEGNLFTTSDPKLIGWLRGHRNFNSQGVGGFWEDGNAPDEPEPKLAAQMAKIKQGAREFNADLVIDTMNLEKSTHNRRAVIEAAELALEVIANADPGPGADADTGNGDSDQPHGSDNSA